MPEIEVVLFSDEDGSCPFLEWIDNLPPRAQDKCIVKIERLKGMGHELRRPEADYLREKIYELRAALQGMQYRILNFFHNNLGVISLGFIISGKKVPHKEIDLAVKRREIFKTDPSGHTFKGV